MEMAELETEMKALNAKIATMEKEKHEASKANENMDNMKKAIRKAEESMDEDQSKKARKAAMDDKDEDYKAAYKAVMDEDEKKEGKKGSTEDDDKTKAAKKAADEENEKRDAKHAKLEARIAKPIVVEILKGRQLAGATKEQLVILEKQLSGKTLDEIDAQYESEKIFIDKLTASVQGSNIVPTTPSGNINNQFNEPVTPLTGSAMTKFSDLTPGVN